jgi:hypothetical protein
MSQHDPTDPPRAGRGAGHRTRTASGADRPSEQAAVGFDPDPTAEPPPPFSDPLPPAAPGDHSPSQRPPELDADSAGER